MKLLISIILTAIMALSLSGCVIVEERYPYRHRHYGGVIITNVPPPPPAVIIRPGPVPPRPPGPPRHRDSSPRQEQRRDLRR